MTLSVGLPSFHRRAKWKIGLVVVAFDPRLQLNEIRKMCDQRM
ncbi:hypothetical protein [Xanthomonas sp. ISO98C4]|nr:hypothetical protein [Xanthomonas sp. ISO98C4]